MSVSAGVNMSKLVGTGYGRDSSPPRDQLVPTYKAEASKAIVGGTTIVENYAFSGVHHIFDQVREQG